MQANPYNGFVALGQSLGTVFMWKPTSSSPLLRLLCYKGVVFAIAFHHNGPLMVKSGKEKKIKLLDLRKLEDEPLQYIS
ncbi:hypothetical protein TB2_006677 [Malus domestica]